MLHPMTESVRCELCHSDQPTHLYEGRDRFLGHAGRFPLVRCAVCGLIYQSPRPIDLSPYYSGDYGPFASPGSNWKPILKRHVAENTDFTGAAGLSYGAFKQVVPWQSGRLLDVGCASGDFLAAMQVRGWDVQGVEPDPESVARANQRLAGRDDGPVQIGSLEAAAYPDGAFDVITLWHVIEHVDHPLATLREIRRILAPHGICIIQTPAWGSLESILFRRFWSGLDSPRHLWIFSLLTMQALAEQAELRIWRRPHSTSYTTYALSMLFLASTLAGRRNGAALFRKLHGGLIERIGTTLLRPLDQTTLSSQLTVALVHKGNTLKQAHLPLQ